MCLLNYATEWFQLLIMVRKQVFQWKISDKILSLSVCLVSYHVGHEGATMSLLVFLCLKCKFRNYTHVRGLDGGGRIVRYFARQGSDSDTTCCSFSQLNWIEYRTEQRACKKITFQLIITWFHISCLISIIYKWHNLTYGVT